MSPSLGALIDRPTLRRMAGARPFERGEDSHAAGQGDSLMKLLDHARLE